MLNVSNAWVAVLDNGNGNGNDDDDDDDEGKKSHTFEATLTCPVGARAMSVGVNGTGAMNNVVAMAITGASYESGYYRIRIKAGSSPSEVAAQLACGTFN